jgi:hypothetical protein
MDTADDFLRAVEWGDGEALLGTLSSSLRAALESRWGDFSELLLEHPEYAGAVVSRVIPYISPRDAAGMSLAGFLSKLLPQLELSAYEPALVSSMSAEMAGSGAVVTVHWMDDRTVDFVMVWEDGSWRIAGSALLEALLQGIF